jgi:hypothetical protein
MKVKDLPQEAVLLQDSQEVRAVYGLRRFVPYLEEPVEVLYRA